MRLGRGTQAHHKNGSQAAAKRVATDHNWVASWVANGSQTGRNRVANRITHPLSQEQRPSELNDMCSSGQLRQENRSAS